MKKKNFDLTTYFEASGKIIFFTQKYVFLDFVTYIRRVAKVKTVWKNSVGF